MTHKQNSISDGLSPQTSTATVVIEVPDSPKLTLLIPLETPSADVQCPDAATMAALGDDVLAALRDQPGVVSASLLDSSCDWIVRFPYCFV
jgi:hypothetical protein